MVTPLWGEKKKKDAGTWQPKLKLKFITAIWAGRTWSFQHLTTSELNWMNTTTEEKG
jgi:hypothetical protein